MAGKASHSLPILGSQEAQTPIFGPFLGLDCSFIIAERNLWMKTFQPEPWATRMDTHFQTETDKIEVPVTKVSKKISKKNSYYGAEWSTNKTAHE